MGLENPLHIALVLVVVLVIFGAKRLPEVGQSLGTGLRGFKDALSGERPREPQRELSAAPDSVGVGATGVSATGVAATGVAATGVAATGVAAARVGAAPGAQHRQ